MHIERYVPWSITIFEKWFCLEAWASCRVMPILWCGYAKGSFEERQRPRNFGACLAGYGLVVKVWIQRYPERRT